MPWILFYIMWGFSGPLEIKELRFNTQAACEETAKFIESNLSDTDESYAKALKANPNFSRRSVDTKCIQDGR